MRLSIRLLIVSALLALPLTLAGPAAADSPALGAIRTATLNGQAISLADVPKYSCTDADYPAIHCFNTEAALVASLAAGGQGLAPLLTTYCIWYWDGNYGSPTFYQDYNEPNLGTYGWNDAISSFKEPNGHYCLWYQDNNYSGGGWDWGAGRNVSYVGNGANDQISSVWIAY